MHNKYKLNRAVSYIYLYLYIYIYICIYIYIYNNYSVMIKAHRMAQKREAIFNVHNNLHDFCN